MNNEYHVLLHLCFWVFLWTFVPFIALPLVIIMVVRQFRAVRRQRKMQEAQVRSNERWLRMEGFQQQQEDAADWWKR